MKQEIGIGLMGLGVVGGRVYQTLQEKREFWTQQIGCPLVVRKILVRHPGKPRPFPVGPSLLTDNPLEVLDHPGVDIIVELIGGETPADEYIRQALLKGRGGVVTANKEVMAKHGPELLALAEEKGVGLRYEASVGAGIPLIASFQQELAANHITTILAIINGTTNYILSRMAAEGLDFATALKKAQELGYAEPNPANDIEGLDAAFKLAILASLAFRSPVHPRDVYHQGISRITSRDFRYARELGYAIKLLAIAREEGESIQARVHPTLVPDTSLLARVDGAFNAVQVEGDLVGKLVFHGLGAGAYPTTSAVVADILDLARRIRQGVRSSPGVRWQAVKPIKPISQLQTRYYLRMSVADRPGVLAQIAKILGDLHISIASVIQKEVDEETGLAEIVIMTHPSLEQAMQLALKEMARLEVVNEVANFLRVEA